MPRFYLQIQPGTRLEPTPPSLIGQLTSSRATHLPDWICPDTPLSTIAGKPYIFRTSAGLVEEQTAGNVFRLQSDPTIQAKRLQAKPVN